MRSFFWISIFLALIGPPVSAEPSTLPLLPSGHFLTFETGFNIDNPRYIRRAIQRRQDEATQAGMLVKPLEAGWSELEPREGGYGLTELAEQLDEYVENGWRPLVLVRVIDSDDVTIPSYLKGSDDPMSLTEIDVSTPRILDRYNALMDQIVPLVREHNGFAIMIANEVDNFLTPHPELTDQVLGFINSARDHIHRLDPDMAVGVALSNGFDYDDDGDRIRAPLPHHNAIIEASDIAVFNFYCRAVPMDGQAESVRERVASRIAAANGKNVIFQEVGCPSGGVEGLSLEHQRRFFAQYFAAVSGTSVRVAQEIQGIGRRYGIAGRIW